MANIGVEPSEIMGAVAMCMTPTQIKEYRKNAIGLEKFFAEGLKIACSEQIVYPDDSSRTKFLKAFEEDLPRDKKRDSDFTYAAVVGMSASIAIRKWVPTRSAQTSQNAKISATAMPETVFLTGDSFPEEIEDFQVERDGFKSYNSSDFVIKFKNPNGLSYYGISLKKKKSLKAWDPTIINKVFDSILQSKDESKLKEIKKIYEKIDEEKEKYFAKIIKEGAKPGVRGAGKDPYFIFESKDGTKTPLPTDPKQVMKIKVDMPGFAKKSLHLINLKGSGKIDLRKPTNQPQQNAYKNIFKIKPKGEKEYREYGKGEMKNIDLSFKAYVNKRNSDPKDSVYNGMIKVMNEYAEDFAQSLINLVLKINLYKEKQFAGGNKFAFALVTGIGSVARDGTPKVLTGRLDSLHTVLCGLSALDDGGTTKFKIEIDENAKKKNERTGKESESATVFLKLMKGKIYILRLELRYKGSFTQQPQFFATIADEKSKPNPNNFKFILTEQYNKICVQP